MQQEGRYLPDGNRVGVLTAAVLLAYALTRLINTPGLTLTMQLPGFYFAYPLTLSTAMTVMATGLTATGMNWLLHSHPSLQGNTIEHWLLPTLTAFIIGVSLNVLPFGTLWWIGLFISAGNPRFDLYRRICFRGYRRTGVRACIRRADCAFLCVVSHADHCTARNRHTPFSHYTSRLHRRRLGHSAHTSPSSQRSLGILVGHWHRPSLHTDRGWSTLLANLAFATRLDPAGPVICANHSRIQSQRRSPGAARCA